MKEATIEVRGHLLDSHLLSKVLDEILAGQGKFAVLRLDIGQSPQEMSHAYIKVTAPDEDSLQSLLTRVKEHGAHVVGSEVIVQNEKITGHFLMCPPEYYGIFYEINPWMSRSRGADCEQAAMQWQALYNALIQQANATVDLLPPQMDLPDMVFAANAGLVVGKRIILSNMRYPERQGESRFHQEWFAAHGYEIIHLPAEHPFEGEGDALFCGENLFAGYRFRSDIETHVHLSEILNRRVISLELINPYFYHLDTCFCPLGSDIAAWYPEAFDCYAREAIEEHIPCLIQVSEEEARRFACNAIEGEDWVIVNKGCERFASQLRELGRRVIELDLSEFIKAGGAAKCLALRI